MHLATVWHLARVYVLLSLFYTLKFKTMHCVSCGLCLGLVLPMAKKASIYETPQDSTKVHILSRSLTHSASQQGGPGSSGLTSEDDPLPTTFYFIVVTAENRILREHIQSFLFPSFFRNIYSLCSLWKRIILPWTLKYFPCSLTSETACESQKKWWCNFCVL